MKNIKPILIITLIVSVLGFLVWDFILMNDLRENYNIDYSSDSYKQIKELKSDSNKDHKKATNNTRRIDEEEPITTRESQIRKRDFEETSSDRDYQEDTKPLLGKKPALNKKESISQKDNTISINLKGQKRSKPQTNTAPRKSIKSINNQFRSNTQHPTSTMR